MLPLLKSISLHMKSHFLEIRNSIGFNQVAVKMIRKDLSDQKGSHQEGGLDFQKPKAGDMFGF